MPAVILNKSEIPPTTGGMIAPPETAIIIRPEISLARVGYFFTVRVKISGKMLEAVNPIKNMRSCAANGVGEKIKMTVVKRVAAAEPVRNFSGENLISKKAPRNVPSILPKK